ncbi:hypothetical protein [Streptomyces odontomachi]|uniref:hypothetical protein n=1 Tax=Streptomyces odontomachi TaxID=2944940 RepID=UPI00210AA5D6|nr:hypothetical protein [Streptomyces sp. ODS25]
MSDEPTLGELARRFEDRLADVREDIQNLGLRLDSRVSLERYQLEREAMGKEVATLTERVKGLEETAREKERLRQADRRLIFSALIVPVLMVLLTVYLEAKGASS